MCKCVYIENKQNHPHVSTIKTWSYMCYQTLKRPECHVMLCYSSLSSRFLPTSLSSQFVFHTIFFSRVFFFTWFLFVYLFAVIISFILFFSVSPPRIFSQYLQTQHTHSIHKTIYIKKKCVIHMCIYTPGRYIRLSARTSFQH